uniref:Uncharacterized protein n=1 Tax=Clandestinovirus TaxID=2831644 RepID=A0A8F8KPE9_9VIRU|nr:hypothetical protein KOM_12_100 [Clandestinovirus]
MCDEVLENEHADEYIRNRINVNRGPVYWRTKDESFADLEKQDLEMGNCIDDEQEDEWDLVDVNFTIPEVEHYVFPLPVGYNVKGIVLKLDYDSATTINEVLESTVVHLSTANNYDAFSLWVLAVFKSALGIKIAMDENGFLLVPLYLTERYPNHVLPVVRHSNRISVYTKGKASFVGISYKTQPLYHASSFLNFSVFTPFKALKFSFGTESAIFNRTFCNDPILGFVVPYTNKTAHLSKATLTCHPNLGDSEGKEIVIRFELHENIHLVRQQGKPLFYIFGFSGIFNSVNRFLQWLSRERFTAHTIEDGIDESTTRHLLRDVGEMHCFNHIRVDHMFVTIENETLESSGHLEYDGTLYSIHVSPMVNNNGDFVARYSC